MVVHGATVVIVDGGYQSYEIERSLLAPFDAHIHLAPCHGDATKVLDVASGADALLVRETPLPAHVIDGLERCRVIVRYGVGVDNIDLARARERGIPVANVPDYGADDVADHALALLLAVKRRLLEADHRVRSGGFGGGSSPPHRIAGATLGLLGCGRIGRRFLHKAAALGFGEVLVHDSHEPPAPARSAGVDETCERADVISLHLPLTEDTRNLLDRGRIERLKPGAVLINTARGGLLDEHALADALASGRLGGAGLDVLDPEPPPADHPLLRAPRCVLSDHIGWCSQESEEELQRQAAEEVARVFRGETPVNWVNRW